jgi:hypothetical protein
MSSYKDMFYVFRLWWSSLGGRMLATLLYAARHSPTLILVAPFTDFSKELAILNINLGNGTEAAMFRVIGSRVPQQGGAIMKNQGGHVLAHYRW